MLAERQTRRSVSLTRYDSPPWIAVTGLAAALRLLHLGAKSFWLDEGSTFVIVHRDWASFWHLLWSHEGNMAFYYVLMRLWLRLGASEFAIRSFSALAGIVTVPLIYLLGKRLFDSRVGLVSALLLAVQTAHVEYSQEARGYSLAVLLCTLSFLFLHDALMRRSGASWALYVAASVLAVYTQFLAALIILAEAVSLLACPREKIRWRHVATAAAAIVLFCVPAVIFVSTNDVGQLAWVPPLSFRQVHHAVTLLTGNGLILVLYAPFLLFGVLSAIRPASTPQSMTSRWNSALVLTWFLVPIMLLLVLSLVKPLFAPRFLLMCVPAAVLLTAFGLSKVRPVWVNVPIIAAILVTSAASLSTYYSKPKEDWRGVTKYVLSSARPDDALVLCDSAAFDYYRYRLQDSNKLPAEFPPASLIDGGANVVGYGRMWIVSFDWRLKRDPECRSAADRLARLFPDSHEKRFGDIRTFLFTKTPQ